MSNARDKANIPALNFSSTGIDDNATSTAITIDSSQRVGIGTSSPDNRLEVQDVGSGVNKLISIRNGDTINNHKLSLGYNAGATSSFIPGNAVFITGETGGAYGILSALSIGTASATPIILATNNAERMRIDSSGNVGIGTSSPSTNLEVRSSSSNGQIHLGASTAGTYGQIYSDNDGVLIVSADAGDNASGSSFRVLVDGGEAMRVDSGLNVLVGNTIYNSAIKGILLSNTGSLFATRDADTVIFTNRLTNDGILINFEQAGTTEGNISVSGSTVSYNGFTGTHWSRFTDNSTPTILRGTVLESLDEMCDWYNLEFDVITQDDDGNDVTTTEKIPHVLTDTQSVGDIITYNHEGTDYQATIVKENDVKHMMSKVSDTVDAKNVYGVFVAYDLDGEGYNDFYVASVGSFVVRIKANETIAKGDLLQSNGDGTAKVQTDDAVRSSSFAKVLSTTVIETYDDGSYLVPCSLMC